MSQEKTARAGGEHGRSARRAARPDQQRRSNFRPERRWPSSAIPAAIRQPRRPVLRTNSWSAWADWTPARADIWAWAVPGPANVRSAAAATVVGFIMVRVSCCGSSALQFLLREGAVSRWQGEDARRAGLALFLTEQASTTIDPVHLRSTGEPKPSLTMRPAGRFRRLLQSLSLIHI